MRSTFKFCLPDWLHEVKYDGYRIRLERDGDRVRLTSRNGYNWTDRYPWILEAARRDPRAIPRGQSLCRQLAPMLDDVLGIVARDAEDRAAASEGQACGA